MFGISKGTSTNTNYVNLELVHVSWVQYAFIGRCKKFEIYDSWSWFLFVDRVAMWQDTYQKKKFKVTKILDKLKSMHFQKRVLNLPIFQCNVWFFVCNIFKRYIVFEIHIFYLKCVYLMPNALWKFLKYFFKVCM